MSEPVTCGLVGPSTGSLTELADLFDRYRTHYGQPADFSVARAWVEEMARSGRLEFYGARQGSQLVGFAAVHEIPASLRLTRFWQLRDLFVDPAARRTGVARRLIDTIREAASDAGAVRLSLQTEPSNAAALALYRQCGFTSNADLVTLSLDLAR